MSAARTPDCGTPPQRAHLQAAQLIGDGRDATDHDTLTSPGWLASRTWWFLVGMAWGAVLVAIFLRLGATGGR